LYTVLVDLAGWTFDRSQSIPKSQRFTFAQRLDDTALDAVLMSVRARYATPEKRRTQLEALNLKLEESRVLWRLVHSRKWISQQQLLFACARIDEAGPRAGGLAALCYISTAEVLRRNRPAPRSRSRRVVTQ
jgi:hypothetical protein